MGPLAYKSLLVDGPLTNHSIFLYGPSKDNNFFVNGPFTVLLEIREVGSCWSMDN